MIQTIRLTHLLREAVRAPYRHLVTRPTGAAVRGRIEAELARTPCRTAVLDFSEIDLVDLSCADEVVAKLLMAAHGPDEPFVVLAWLRDDQCEAIDHVLRHHRLAVATVPCCGTRPRLLGWIRPDVQDAFTALCDAGSATPAELAALLGWPTDRAEAALRELAAHRLADPAGDRYRPLPIG